MCRCRRINGNRRRQRVCHESGIHQHGVINNRLTYEIISPESVGIYQNRMVLGKHSGRHAFEERLDQLGYRLPESVLEQSFRKFKVLADRKKIVTDRDIEALISSNRYQMHGDLYVGSFCGQQRHCDFCYRCCQAYQGWGKQGACRQRRRPISTRLLRPLIGL